MGLAAGPERPPRGDGRDREPPERARPSRRCSAPAGRSSRSPRVARRRAGSATPIDRAARRLGRSLPRRGRPRRRRPLPAAVRRDRRRHRRRPDRRDRDADRSRRASTTRTVNEWYRFLNCGYRLPVLGGTDKMSAEMPLGGVRTYARLDPEAAPTFEAWAAAVRAGRTFATSGPVIELTVDGHEPGDVIALAGRWRTSRRCRSGRGPPSRSSARRARRERPGRRPRGRSRRIGRPAPRRRGSRSTAGSWIAARSRSDHEIQSAYLTSMAAHTSPVYVEVARPAAVRRWTTPHADPRGDRRDRTMARDDGDDRRSGPRAPRMARTDRGQRGDPARPDRLRQEDPTA